jgi:guanine deaminase
MTDREFLMLAVESCRKGVDNGQTPFAAIVVKDGRVVADTTNTVWRDTDPTAHAEVNAIRAAARALKTIDLSGCVMYTTTEPCPMCLSAIHWAKIDRVVYGATIDDAAAAGFNELRFPARKLAQEGGSKVNVEQLNCSEARELFAYWKKTGKSGTY